jgi:hypothetical protein
MSQHRSSQNPPQRRQQANQSRLRCRLPRAQGLAWRGEGEEGRSAREGSDQELVYPFPISSSLYFSNKTGNLEAVPTAVVSIAGNPSATPALRLFLDPGSVASSDPLFVLTPANNHEEKERAAEEKKKLEERLKKAEAENTADEAAPAEEPAAAAV